MATPDQREEWATLQASAPQRGKGKPSPEEIEAARTHSHACKAFLSGLSPEAVQELTGKKKKPADEATLQLSATGAHAGSAENATGQHFDYFLVVDFEATCNAEQRGEGALTPQEIIEFPVALLNSATLEVESVFHCFVKPVVHPRLTDFCTELTGVTQEQVDAGLDLGDALDQLDRWMEHHCLHVVAVPAERRRSFLFVSCGDWDLNHLRSQCKKQQLAAPQWSRRVCNLKYMYERVFGTRQVGMMGMLQGLCITHTGKHHSGIDDVRNITAILQKLIEEHGVTIGPTPGSQAVHAFLGPSSAALGLVPRVVATSACPARPVLASAPSAQENRRASPKQGLCA
mmetsp:Transcript_73358/g.194652  ORF Transcript_73358/g.194652 Transcript_73358/m.194652 type:complete len:344 (+) Transcript_73358:80-1111(+)